MLFLINKNNIILKKIVLGSLDNKLTYYVT